MQKVITDNKYNYPVYYDREFITESGKVYIYGLGYNNSNKLFIENKLGKPDLSNLYYIGKTINPISRLSTHYSDGLKYFYKKNSYKFTVKDKWIGELIADGLIPFMRLLDVCTVKESEEFETEYCRRLYDKIQYHIVNRSLLKELRLKKNKIDLEPLFKWDVENQCYYF